VTETIDEEVTERDIEIGETIGIVVSDGGPGPLITEPQDATTKAIRILQAETTEQENEKIDMVDEVEVNETSASGTEIVAHVGGMMVTGRLDATAICSKSGEVAVETEASEVAGTVAVRIETSLRRRPGAAKRVHHRRRRRGSQHQT
jgi:hypothetical protein